MPYFKNNDINLLFIHIPKTGGVSLENYFRDKFNIPLNDKSLYMFLDKEIKVKNNIDINSSLQHITYQTIMKYKDFFNIIDDNIDIITIVRNPYERIISDLFFFLKINIETSKDEVFHIIENYILDSNLDNHNIPQYLFITDSNKKLIPNIKILHTETLNDDFINLGYEDFNENDNKNNNIYNNRPINKNDYYDYLNDNSIKLINDYYHYDFTLFNYTKISKPKED